MGLGAASVGLSVLGPRLLGDATNLIFSGVTAKKLPAGVTKVEMVARLRHEGHSTLASMLASMNLVPGRGSTSATSAKYWGWCSRSTSQRRWGA